MCFSAEASFTAAALLGAVSYGTLTEVKSRKETFLALIPLLFAIQQFSEGLIWYALNNGMYPTTFSLAAESVFLFFAFIMWPIWIPLSAYALEKVRWKKKVILASMCIGVVFVIGNLLLLPGNPLSVSMVSHSLQYNAYVLPTSMFYYVLKAAYLIAVLVPCFVSSFPKLWVFGILIAISVAIADYLYFSTFSSTWCFFAAVISGYVLVLLKQKR